jgi:hypothetical protein
MLITENQLDEWVRGNARDAQGVVVELVYRLIAASCPRPKERRFPLPDSIGQHGPDGVLNTEIGFDPFVPEGRSFWEIGTRLDAGDKATIDYRDLTAATPDAVRRKSTFIFVTPLSGRRDWPYTWKENAQATWLEERRERNEWLDVRVIDGSVLIDWMKSFLPVELWLADKMRFPIHQLQTIEDCWDCIRTIGDPPPLPPALFLANRSVAQEKLKGVFWGATSQLKIETLFPEQTANFVAAYVAGMEEEARTDAFGRCVIVSSVEAWNGMLTLREPHILVAGFDLEDSAGTTLLEKARRAGHIVIFGGMPGGIPHPNQAPIPNPTNHQVVEALKGVGYPDERARTLAQKCNGNLTSLLRCLQNLSLMPEWAQGTDAAELAIAEILGTWNEHSDADRTIAEKFSGKGYGEWIGKMREIALRPGTPLTQREGAWKFVSRFEGWYALGPQLFDEHLDRILQTIVSVLREEDPALAMSPNERHMANIRGKVFAHSPLIRQGLSESLALLGSHPEALRSCSFGKPEGTARLAVRRILEGADWKLWASLDDVLPLLAEAAPEELLTAVSDALIADPCPFDVVFAQERSGITGRNYLTGLLWALETVAWDSEHLIQVVILLGELAARDPGGNWGNRPANSLATILLPWFPQTTASASKRQIAVSTLLDELPDIAWTLLMSLLPQMHQVSLTTRKPTWRRLIPDDWSDGVTNREYYDQVVAYADLAISAAKRDRSKLSLLIDDLIKFPPPARSQLLSHLGTEEITSMPEEERLPLWNELVDLISKHRKFASADWAMASEEVDQIAEVAHRLQPNAPALHYQRLFTERDFDLYEEKDDFAEQLKRLEGKRRNAISEVFSHGGVEAVLQFARAVKSPSRVGHAFGAVADSPVETQIFPNLLASEEKSLSQFTGGFVLARYGIQGWKWVDRLNTAQWTSSQKAQFFAYLPFTSETWTRAQVLLGAEESLYWSKVSANPFQTEVGLEIAVDRLLENDRVHEAVLCFERIIHDKQPLDNQQAIRTLYAVLESPRNVITHDAYAIVDIIKTLQETPKSDVAEISNIEWAFLPLLDEQYEASPKLLGQRLANDPGFFCEVIRLIFKSRNKEVAKEERSEQQRLIATNGYRLLQRWKTLPGSHEGQPFKGEALNDWLAVVKTSCAESGHLEVALQRVGNVLFYSPPDPDGLWLHHSVACVLNARDADDIRTGFQTEIFNSRGAFFVDPQGRPERELAKKYRGQADEVEIHGYHRLATALREVAASYDRQAERQASKSHLDDD